MRRVIFLLSVSLLGCDDKTTGAPAASSSAAPAASGAGTSAGSSAASSSGSSSAPAPEKSGIAAGDMAPDVELALQDGSKVKLSSLRGSLVLVYFYPKDDTPGCTAEAQGLRDNYEELTKIGVKVIGVSMQDAESHKAFIDKYDLPFPLAVDDGTVAAAFDVPLKGEFASRHSFLIGKDGKLLKVWREVKPKDHAKEVLEAARS